MVLMPTYVEYIVCSLDEFIVIEELIASFDI